MDISFEGITFERRRRSYGMHAETQEEYLEKCQYIDQYQQTRQNHSRFPYKQKSNSSDGYAIRAFEFDFNCQLQEEVNSQQNKQIQIMHRILLISTDGFITPFKIQQLIEEGSYLGNQILLKIDLGDSQTMITDDSMQQEPDNTYPFDIYVHTQTQNTNNHKFDFWIQNSTTTNPLLQTFEKIYYPKFSAFILICSNTEEQKLIAEKFAALNPSAQKNIVNLSSFETNGEDNQISSEIKGIQSEKIQTLLKNLIA